MIRLGGGGAACVVSDGLFYQVPCPPVAAMLSGLKPSAQWSPVSQQRRAALPRVQQDKERNPPPIKGLEYSDLTVGKGWGREVKERSRGSVAYRRFYPQVRGPTLRCVVPPAELGSCVSPVVPAAPRWLRHLENTSVHDRPARAPRRALS